MKYLKYFMYVIKHKWYVYLAGFGWMGVIHDWSKFRPSEFFPYAEHFYGKGIEANCYKCGSIQGSQCGYNGSGIGDGVQAVNCKDYEAKGRRDETGYYKPTDTGDADFDFAWLLHQKRNKHHWQWWILPEDEAGIKIFPMPEKYRYEMLFDWLGASKAQGHGGDLNSVWKWYEKNGHKMQLHPDTRRWVESVLMPPLIIPCECSIITEQLPDIANSEG